jgi:hypothetical protein
MLNNEDKSFDSMYMTGKTYFDYLNEVKDEDNDSSWEYCTSFMTF